MGCDKGDKEERAFSEYAKNQNIPNYNGISSIECTDSILFAEYAAIPTIEHQIDSVKKCLDKKVRDMVAYYGTLNYANKQRLATEYARIGAEYGELCVNDIDSREPIDAIQDALEELSPYKLPLYIYHIIAKVGAHDVSFYAFAVGDDISIVKADDKADAMRKNQKLMRFQEAIMDVINTKLVPRSMLIDDVDSFMGNDKTE